MCTSYLSHDTQLSDKLCKILYICHAEIHHLGDIRAALVKVNAHWYNIGVYLGVDTNTLDGFKRKFKNDCDRCLSSTIDAWLKQTKP